LAAAVLRSVRAGCSLSSTSYRQRRSPSARATLQRVTDTRTPDERKRIMAAVRQRDTEPEVALRKALHRAGVRGWRCNFRGAPGRPDIAWPALKVAVFVDGAFWHGHPSRHRPGRSGAYWDEKIAGNVMRDRRIDAELTREGWQVVRVWDFQVRKEPEKALERVVNALSTRLPADESAPAWQKAFRRSLRF
jgi:DNA mismatch endonuclease, patch repair protein